MTTRSVAIISAVAPYPVDAGKKVVLAGLLDYWTDRLGADAVHYVHVATRSAPQVESAVHVHRLEGPRTREQVVSLLRRTFTGRRSLQESMLYAPRVRRGLAAVLHSIGADLEIYDTVRLGQYAEQIPAAPHQRRVLYLDDLFSVRYERMLAVLRQQPDADVDPLGEFRHVIPRGAVLLAERPVVQRLLLQAERWLVRRSELASAREFSLSLLVSPSETKKLSTVTGVGTVRSLPPVIDPPVGERAYSAPPTFVLLGLLSLPHNHDAAMTFLNECMPRVRELMPDARVQVVGRGAKPELLDLAAAFGEQVEVTGFVPDLEGLLATACAVVAPLRFGSGLKIKVLDALAHGVPVLTTPVGAEGIDAGDDTGIVCETDVARFPEAMQRMADPTVNASLSASARRHHQRTYAAAAAFATYDDIFATATK